MASQWAGITAKDAKQRLRQCGFVYSADKPYPTHYGRFAVRAHRRGWRYGKLGPVIVCYGGSGTGHSLAQARQRLIEFVEGLP